MNVWGFPKSAERRILWDRTARGDRMASRSELITTACEIALDRRHRSDESMLAEMQQRFDHDNQASQAAAEFWMAWAVAVKEELGEQALQQTQRRHRLVGGNLR